MSTSTFYAQPSRDVNGNYIPVAARPGIALNAPRPELGLGAAYPVQRPTPRPNMRTIFMYEAMAYVLAWWTARYERVGVHARGGVTVGSYLRRRNARLSRTVPDAVVADLCGRYDAYGSELV